MNVRSPFLFALLVGVAAAFIAAPASAQIDEPEPLVVMNLAAHPDDEDGLTLAYYRHVQDAAAYSVIYTRGEGGQNEIGPDLYEKLGAIRTAETEAAARILGTQVRFLNFYDFGYSKFASESFEAWGGRDAVTARLVYFVRKLKPDVIFTNHDTLTVGNTQHGHHQVVGLSAYDAFALAADPSFHPEHLAELGVDLWQPKRLFLRKWRWRGGEGSQAADVKVPVGDLIPGRDASAADVAIEAVGEHRSQGFDKFAPRFRRDTTYFQLLRSAPGVPPLPNGATSLAAGLSPNEHAADASLAYLIDSGRITAELPGGADLLPDASIVLPGDAVPVRWTRDLTFHSSTGQPIPVEIVFSGAVDTTVTVAPGAAPAAVLRIPADATPTLPADARQYDRTLSTPPIQYAVQQPGDAEALYAADHLPLEIAPPIAIEPAAQVIRLRPGTNRIPVRALLYDGDIDSVVVGINMDERGASETRITLESRTFAAPTDGVLDEAVTLTLDEAEVTPGPYPLTLSAVPIYGDGNPRRGVPVTTTQLARALPPVSVPDGLRVGFVRSYDDATLNALRDLGATVVPLDSAALARGDFDDLHTIVVDIRAYLVRSDLRRHNDTLLDWVRDGGHLVVNYQKTFEWNPEYDDPFVASEQNPAGFAPYPLLLGRDRVTYEDAPVTILTPDHVLFREPHEITAADWDDWVQERGLYFPADYDDRYTELLAMNDPGEAPLRSSTLFAEVGEGTYLYTALGWYRQLAAFNPGAYRLFANLVSLPLVDERAASSRSDARADG